MPELTIITVNLNNAEGLCKTIKSVANQTFSDFEYIVVDGASTDGSIAIIKEYNDKISNWISKPDKGIYQAMNKGIRMANGKYLLFLNSGDFLLNKNVLENVFENKPSADMLCGKCNVSEKGKVVWTSNPPQTITFGVLYHIGLAHQSTFIRRTLFHSFGLYREDFKYNSDIDFWYKAIILGNATTQAINTIVSDYNLDGISSKENQTDKYQFEIDEILSQSNFHKFIPDYKVWQQEKKDMEIYYWAKSKMLLNGVIQWAHKLAISRNNKKLK